MGVGTVNPPPLDFLLLGLEARPLHAQDPDSAAVRAVFDSTVAGKGRGDLPRGGRLQRRQDPDDRPGRGGCTAWLGGEGSPFADHLQEDRVTIIDLRALRPGYFNWEFLSDELRRAILSFDAYMAIPDVQHSEPLNPVPRGE